MDKDEAIIANLDKLREPRSVARASVIERLNEDIWAFEQCLLIAKRIVFRDMTDEWVSSREFLSKLKEECPTDNYNIQRIFDNLVSHGHIEFAITKGVRRNQDPQAKSVSV